MVISTSQAAKTSSDHSHLFCCDGIAHYRIAKIRLTGIMDIGLYMKKTCVKKHNNGLKGIVY